MTSTYAIDETTARVRQWQHLTGADFDAMDRERTVVIVSCSPLEVHGPHLPTGADVFESDAISVRAMELLSDQFDDIQFVHMPALWVSTDVVPHPGSVHFRPSTLERVLVDMGRSLTRQGFRHIWVMNFHGGPRHFVAIEAAADKVNRRWGGRMVSIFSLLIDRLTAGSTDPEELLAHIDGLDREVLAGDTHGGVVETSILLRIRGAHVRDVFRQLPRQTLSTWLLREGRRPMKEGEGASLWQTVQSFVETMRFYSKITYAGAPAAASAEIGERLLEELAAHAAEAMGEVWTGALDPSACHSPLWRLRWVVLNEPLVGLFQKVAGFRSQVF